MKVKTADLIGPALDWAVAKCLGVTPIAVRKNYSEGWLLYSRPNATIPLEYSSKWAQGGPIIEREGVALRRHSSGTWYATKHLGDGQSATWARHNYLTTSPGQKPALLLFDGPTPLIAAMRALVASKFGDEVDVPDELV